MRDEFTLPVKRILAERVAHHCSNPDCRAHTVAPQLDETKSVSVGTASHITAAAVLGPRYDASLSEPERKHINNAIWLCRTCGTLIDADPDRFPVALLHEWKRMAEEEASTSVGQAKRQRDDDQSVSAVKIKAAGVVSGATTHLKNRVALFYAGNFEMAPNKEHQHLSEELNSYADTIAVNSWLLGEAVTRLAGDVHDFCCQTVADINRGNSHCVPYTNNIDAEGTEIRHAAWTQFSARMPELRRRLDDALADVRRGVEQGPRSEVDRPQLVVSFADGQKRCEAERDARIIDHEYGRYLNSTTRRWAEMSTPTRLRLYLKNTGRAIAENIQLSVVFPDGCRVSPEGDGAATSSVSGAGRNVLELELPISILHDPHQETLLAGLLVETPDKGRTYPISWKAHCKGMREPTSGELELFVVPHSV